VWGAGVHKERVAEKTSAGAAREAHFLAHPLLSPPALAADARLAHANACLDAAETSAAKRARADPEPARPRARARPPARSPAPACPVCSKPLAAYGLARRRAHVNACCDGVASPGAEAALSLADAAVAGGARARARARPPPADPRAAERALLDALYPAAGGDRGGSARRRSLRPSALAESPPPCARAVPPAKSLWRAGAAASSPALDGAGGVAARVAAARAAAGATGNAPLADTGALGPDSGCGPSAGHETDRSPPAGPPAAATDRLAALRSELAAARGVAASLAAMVDAEEEGGGLAETG